MNNQQVRKIISFYKINYNFHEPYNLLLDGNFISYLVQKQIDLVERWSCALASKCLLHTTRCVLRQLQLLGSDYHLVVERARVLKLHPCSHPPQQDSADACLASALAQQNTHQFIICTQDTVLRALLRNYQQVPIMYVGHDQRITLENLQTKNIAKLNQEISKKYTPAQTEIAQINLFKKEQWKINKIKKKQEMLRRAAEKGVKPKTKIAQQPNPLAVKKKIIVHQIGKNQSQIHEESKKKRIRKRKNK